MEVSQVVQLANWYQTHFQEVKSEYSALVSVLQNNSQQASQQPVADPLKALSRALREMPTSELSTLQMQVLERLGVAHLVGKAGRAWIIRTVQTKTYDPATTFQTVQEAFQKMEQAQNQLDEFKNSAARIGFKRGDVIDTPTPYAFNVIFQGGAAITNVTDWKRTAADWELYLGSVAVVAGERPEDVAVVGAQNGSIIFTLSAAPIVTKILATVSKHIASIANDYLDFQLKREELERSRMYSDAIKKDLTRQERERREESKAALMKVVREMQPNAAPEAITKLEKAIDRYITFTEKGGEMDYMLPPPLDAESEDYDEDLAQAVEEVRDLIQDYREEVQKTKLLTHEEDDDEFDDDS
ncbi:hypothetical protein [Marimonas arenosa]|uniref:Uncharacterized protein n=1 Tax=Marimonas arenosa TaxID=1795305 RepID=A0AAE4B4R7_9RHOB|nr:hypothetical protein [Marimonas arenosa]MDQ2090515.1 hypothetical protein [Marimonas arenosa]